MNENEKRMNTNYKENKNIRRNHTQTHSHRQQTAEKYHTQTHTSHITQIQIRIR